MDEKEKKEKSDKDRLTSLEAEFRRLKELMRRNGWSIE